MYDIRRLCASLLPIDRHHGIYFEKNTLCTVRIYVDAVVRVCVRYVREMRDRMLIMCKIRECRRRNHAPQKQKECFFLCFRSICAQMQMFQSAVETRTMKWYESHRRIRPRRSRSNGRKSRRHRRKWRKENRFLSCVPSHSPQMCAGDIKCWVDAFHIYSGAAYFWIWFR